MRFLTIKEVAKTVRLSESTIKRLLRLGEFPTPVHLSPRRVFWLESEIQKWVKKLARKESKHERQYQQIAAGADVERD